MADSLGFQCLLNYNKVEKSCHTSGAVYETYFSRGSMSVSILYLGTLYVLVFIRHVYFLVFYKTCFILGKLQICMRAIELKQLACVCLLLNQVYFGSCIFFT